MPKFSASALVASILAIASTSQAAVYSGAGGPLIDGSDDDFGLSQFDIPVSGTAGVVTSLNSVTLTLEHTWVGDTAIEIYSPDGTFVSLASPPDARSSNYNGTYTFVVDPTKQTIAEASTGLASTSDIPSGEYAPSSYAGTANGPRTNYSGFVGDQVDGVWSLLIGDFLEGNTGTLVSWSFDVSYSVVPEPGTAVAIAGVAGFGMLRRRAGR